MSEPTDTISPADVDEPQIDSAVELTEELLVEEISIDGMCGVY
jgi:mycofactocin precursor